MIRVLIVDDHPVVRAGLRAVLSSEPDIEVVADLGEASAAIDAIATLRPDVVLMDLQFPTGMQGAEATGLIRSGAAAQGWVAPPAVLILTNYDSDRDIVRAIDAGATSYLLKDAPPDVLVAAIRSAAAGDPVRGAVLLAERAELAPLSRRELEVLELVAAGESNRAIAAALHLSEATVKSHLARINHRLGATSRTDAVARAREWGVLRD
ncbi:response regulator transcription factor [Agromyces intestinalis]|uniref:Response regulator transcription factor n=1 Tax=Agromyces intestinalis TaxID=2592652 RepID=A0A5C1YGP8_9MICO|nr:response regulator transcription factor [Agromyces intestinalis]QEO14695.1 response regulator transcription factor [Agromyces intestinalis]